MIKPGSRPLLLANITFRCESLCPAVLIVFEKSSRQLLGEKEQSKNDRKAPGQTGAMPGESPWRVAEAERTAAQHNSSFWLCSLAEVPTNIFSIICLSLKTASVVS